MRSKLTLVALAVLAIALSTTVSGRTGGIGAQQPSGSPQKPPAQGSDQQAPPPQGGAQNGQPGQPLPTFKTGINFVRVDVIASTSKGEPVVDLKKEDFIVTEDGKPQTVESFKLIKLDQITDTTPPREIKSSFDEESEAQREDVRDLPRRLPHSTGRRDVRARTARELHPYPASAFRHGRAHVPAHARERRGHVAQLRSHRARRRTI
jgi:hypothetical protein